MSKLPFLLIVNLIFINLVYSQSGISVSTTGSPADNSAILDISSTSQGLLIPRMTTAQRDAITSPATSLLIFNTTTNCFESFVNGSWYSVSCPPSCTNPAVPTSGTNLPSQAQIVWNWNSVSSATGYKWSTTNNFSGASDNGLNFTYTQTGLTCNTSYTLYVWAYNSCGNSSYLKLTQTTSACNQTCGSQVWESSNLNSGSQIPVSSGPQAGNQKYCYNDIPNNCDIYGGLYEWADVMLGASSVNCDPCGPTTGHGGVSGMCPYGYHIPSDLEWSRYEYCLEDSISPKGSTDLATFQTATGWRGSVSAGVGAGDKMKATSPAWDGTNASGFSMLPAGNYYSIPGLFSLLNGGADFWMATEANSSEAWYRALLSGYSHEIRNSGDRASLAFSVRCLKD
jgi:uncharacterized protein (TIGR02145 family)